MKDTLIKIKNNLQGINRRVDEAKNQISGLEYKEAKNNQLEEQALDDVPRWIESDLQTKRSLVWFPVGAHAWVVGQVLSWGHVRGNQSKYLSHINASLPFSLLSPLSKNK